MGNIATAQDLKGLLGQLAKERAYSDTLRQELSIAQKKFNQSQTLVKTLEDKIRELKTEAPTPIISEHALLRYMERVQGVNFDVIKAELLGDGTAGAISFAKTGKIKKNGMTLICRDNVVVTIE